MAVASPALAKVRHHQEEQRACLDQNEVGGIIILGLVLGAVNGGVGSAMAWGGAYALGGAAVGGASGLALSAVHTHEHC